MNFRGFASAEALPYSFELLIEFLFKSAFSYSLYFFNSIII